MDFTGLLPYVALFGVVAALIGPPITVWVTRRLDRGKERAAVAFSEEQFDQLRGQIWQQINSELRLDLDRMRQRLTDAESRANAAETRAAAAEMRAATAEAEVSRLRAEVGLLTEELSALRGKHHPSA